MTGLATLRPLAPPAGRAVLLLLVFSAAPALARDCPEHFAGGTPPALTNPRLSADTTLLCYQAFAILYSGLSRTPLYAAEHLTAARVEAARRIDRVDAFHEEDRLPEAMRSDLADYAGSGWDRGHMAPSGDMPSPSAQAESFSLANIVPQNRVLNRGLWAAIEESVRRLATERGEIFVVTGPIFEGRSVGAIKGRVLVPEQLFKAIYDPRTGEAGAYLAPNAAGAQWRAVPLATLRDIAGLDVFPALPEAAKAKAMTLPEPQEFSRDGQESFADFLKQLAIDVLRRLWRELMRAIF